jgi:hypothetical protein
MSLSGAATVFILGCERSGSTWLGNILDAHAGVEFWMEPFAPYAKIFPGFPDRNIHVARPEEGDCAIIRARWPRLTRYKYPLLRRHDRALSLRAVDQLLGGAIVAASNRLRIPTPAVINRYQLLNLNRSEIPIRSQTRKAGAVELVAVKELRLNFKAAVLREVFPASRCLVTIRHPGAQLLSILERFATGSLRELFASLEGFFTAAAHQARFASFHEELRLLPASSSMADRLILWWLINYNTLLEDLDARGLPWKLVPHEGLCADPRGVVQEVFAFADLRVDDGVRRYLEFSTTGAQRSASPLDTVRRSREYSKSRIDQASPEIMESVQRTLRSCVAGDTLHPSLRRYLDTLEWGR